MTTPNVHYCPHCRSLKAKRPNTACVRCAQLIADGKGWRAFFGICRVLGVGQPVFIVPWSRRPVRL